LWCNVSKMLLVGNLIQVTGQQYRRCTIRQAVNTI